MKTSRWQMFLSWFHGRLDWRVRDDSGQLTYVRMTLAQARDWQRLRGGCVVYDPVQRDTPEEVCEKQA